MVTVPETSLSLVGKLVLNMNTNHKEMVEKPQAFGNGDGLLVTNHICNLGDYFLHPSISIYFTVCLLTSPYLIFKHQPWQTHTWKDFSSQTCVTPTLLLSHRPEGTLFLHLHKTLTLSLGQMQPEYCTALLI